MLVLGLEAQVEAQAQVASPQGSLPAPPASGVLVDPPAQQVSLWQHWES